MRRQLATEAEISDLDHTVGCHEKVRRLDVAAIRRGNGICSLHTISVVAAIHTGVRSSCHADTRGLAQRGEQTEPLAEGARDGLPSIS